LTSERRRRIREVFEAACDLPEAERGPFVLRESDGDEALAVAVSRLLVAQARSGGLLDTPSWAGREDYAATLEIGSRVGPYKILRELEGGGMGIVYQVVRADEVFHRVSALKIVRPGFAGESLLDRFRKERQILALLDHHNIARIVDGGSTPAGLPYFVMDFVEGVPIDAFCRQNELTVRQRLRIFTQVCAAAQYLHDHRVAHGDLKPSNILVTNDGVVKILDFGIANVLRSVSDNGSRNVVALMTPEYASPEQLGGDDIGPQSDIYSMGVVLYEVLTGSRPYSAEGGLTTDPRRIIDTNPPLAPSAALSDASRGEVAAALVSPREINAEVDAIVLRAIARDSKARYASGNEFLGDIESYLDGRPVKARGGGVFYRGRKFVHRNAALATASCAIVCLLGLVSWQAVELNKRRDRSDAAQKVAADIQKPAVSSLSAKAADQFSKAGQRVVQGAEFEQIRQSQLLQVRKLAEAYRTSFAESIRLWPGMTASRRNLVDQADQYLRHVEVFARDDPKASEQLAMAWLWMAKIQGDPGNANLNDQAGAATSVREAERLIANSSSPTAQVLLSAIRSTARNIEQARNLKPEI
jgi:hypothetical protein